MSKGLFLRMENIEGGGAEEVSAETTLANEVGASDAVEAVESASGDVTDVVTGIEDASDAAGEISEVQGSLEEAVDSGEGISEREAVHIQARMEAIAKKLGTTTDAMHVTFRKESFGGNNSKLAATKVRLEFVKGLGAKVWDIIKKAWEWVKGAVAKLLETITGSASRLQERLKGLQKQVADAKAAGKVIGTEPIKSKAGVFSIDGVTSPDTIYKFLENGVAYAQILDAIPKRLEPANIEKMAGSDLKAFSEGIIAEFAKGAQAGSVPGAEGSKGLIRLPGNRAVIAVSKKVKSGDADVEILELSVGKADEKTAESYKPLSYDEMTKILSAALSGANGLSAFQKAQKNLENVTKANIAHAEAMAKAGSNTAKREAGDDEGKQTSAAGATAALKALHDLSVKAVNTAANTLPKACFDVLAGAGDVVAASLSSGKGPEKEKEEKK